MNELTDETNSLNFINNSDHKFIDISSELWRQYEFHKDGREVLIQVDQPAKLSVSASGGHRVFDCAGICHYIQPGWLRLKWKAKPGLPNFVA